LGTTQGEVPTFKIGAISEQK